MNKAAALEKEIKIKWENSTETGTVQVGGLVYDDYEKWEALMNEVLDTIEKNIPENEYNNLISEQNNWAQKRDKRGDELSNNYEELGLMARGEGASHLLRETEDRTYHLINTYFYTSIALIKCEY